VPVRLRAAVFLCAEPAPAAAFWAGVLGRHAVEDAHGVLLAGGSTQLGLRFGPGPHQQDGSNAMHVHLTSASAEQQLTTVATALELGARHLDVGQRPEEGHVVLADPAGHAFCVIEPGNSFLAGCGVLGELACDGSRDVGVFWSAALSWPLVWDQEGETAVQSPHGGTKVAWGGEPAPPVDQRQSQHLELVVVDGDAAAEVERLLALGATRRESGGAAFAVLADPDGVEFRVHPR
jgi:catechol 2,3-dioxygenase-like lactoylglutathione lyase family enzyme